MSLRKNGVLWVALFALSACGRQIVEFRGTDADDPVASGTPTVISTVPVDTASSVARDTAISATFSEGMDPATITALTLTVRQGSTPVSGTVVLDGPGRTARFTPTDALGSGLVYTATISTAAEDLQGHALAASYTWSFTTSVVFLRDPPTVIFTSPLDLATNVSITKQVTATFSKAMDPSTLRDLTFTLSRGITRLVGAVSYDALTNTATFSPDEPLELDTDYAAIVTTGARDATGVALLANYAWAFKTGLCSQGRVDLGAAGTFAALAGATVTSTGPTTITGNLGVSPSTAITGFPPGIVIGTQHSGDPAAATAKNDLTTAYNDAALRTGCAVPVSGNIGARTLTPGLHTSSSSLSITSGDLTLDAQGDGDAVFVFTITSTLTVTSGLQVILTNGARAKNIYWQVGSSATLGTNSVFQGTIMAEEAITLATGATLNGRALARTAAVSLDSNTIVIPPP